VAIADVSYYVKQHTALDREAEKRGNSVYFPERVVPMLPEKLSNGLCSLNPRVDRLCLVCDMEVDASGAIKKYRFYEAVMNSKARMTYKNVYDLLQGDQPLRESYKTLVSPLENLYKLYKILREHREERGALDFDTVETKIIFSKNKKIDKIIPAIRNEAHMLIEECMLAANECAAKFLKKHKLPGLFRNHEMPREEKLLDLRKVLSLRGLQLGGGAEPTPKHYQQLLEEIKQYPDAEALQMLVLRSLNQAEYSPENLGHFGLAYKEYGHFTSPIRRYSDLLMHRAIRHFLVEGSSENFNYTHEMMQKLGEHCSLTERRADEATRDVINWLKCEYMSHHIAKEYTGKIASVVAFGLFVQLNEVYVEGLVHVTALHGDYYHFTPEKQMLMGEKTRKKYVLGQTLKVRVIRVDIDQRKIDFELV
jgi:ribonuclease R